MFVASQSLLDLRSLPAGAVDAPQDEPARVEDDSRILFATYLFPELRQWLSLLERVALPIDRAACIAAEARRNGTDFQTELLVSGVVGEDEFFRAVAKDVGVRFEPAIRPDRLIVSEAAAMSALRSEWLHVPIKLSERDGATSFVVAPKAAGLDRLRRAVAGAHGVARRMKVTSPRALRSAMLSLMRPRVAHQAIFGLFERFPNMSARLVTNAWQGAFVGALLVALPMALSLAPAQTYMALHIFFSLFFLACVGLRFAALAAPWPRRHPAEAAVVASELPVYSVLVALYREAEIVPALVEALSRLEWPRAKLEIKLVCEADDGDTLDAIAALDLPRNVEVVEVPVEGPRTKPKALAYALPLTGGEFIALYDAEDQPHPRQLVEAWRAFGRAGPELACVQAPLEITNRDESAVAMMFAFEYAALFRGLLPWLSSRRLLLPLGGTSNHFRRAALEEVGGWDPYNVTEDADLGVRLARFGFRTETIAPPTGEAAPADIATWLPQRTRWMKGWLHTWLVHMRNPLRLWRELGTGSFLIAQILFAGLVVSALVHPFLVVTAIVLAVEIALARPMGVWRSALFAVDIVNIACGYVSFLLLGWQTLDTRERKNFWRIVLFTPPYWLLMSVAAWRAVWQLWRRPHFWDKTPHLYRPAEVQRNFGPEPMILESGLPTASMSRPV